MAKMANWKEINAKIGSTIGSPDSKCPTKANILATGKAAVSSSYANNQLMPLEAISAPKPELKDNIITLSVSRLDATTWQVVAAAQYITTSAVTIEGTYHDDFSAGGIYFNLIISANSGTGYTTFTATKFATFVELENANIYPASDSKYKYILQG